ncbi:unnamed protein product [Pylaiella littoralis]
MGYSTQDTFYVDPRVEGCDGLSSRAKRLGLKMKDFLSEGVTVCVAAASPSLSSSAGDEAAATATAAAGAGADQSRGRRLSRIHRMQQQQQQCRNREHSSITKQARQLRATVLSGQAFGSWLDRQESKRATARTGAGTGAGAGAGAGAVRTGTGGGKGKAAARPLILPRQQQAGTSRFKSQEHPRVVMKDLDGLEPDRVQAFPPELLRKCNLHTDAPPGICPFTPREQWHREVLRVKKKDTAGAAKVAARMLPSGAQKIRRGGWCECCERQYIGTMSEHCAGDPHRAAVARDPNYAVLLALESWTGAQDGWGCAGSTDTEASAADGPTAGKVATEAAALSTSSAVAATSGAGASGSNVTTTVILAPVSLAEAMTNRREEGGKVPPPPAAAVNESLQGGGGEKKLAAPRARDSTPRRRPTSSGESVNGNEETLDSKEDSPLRGTLSPSGLRDATAGGRALRSSPRHRSKGKVVRCREAGAEAAGGGSGGGGAGGRRGGQRCVSTQALTTIVQPRPRSLGSGDVISDSGGCAGNLATGEASALYGRGADDAISCREKIPATHREDTARRVAVADAGIPAPPAGKYPHEQAITGRRNRSSPLPCRLSRPQDVCGTPRVDEQAGRGLSDFKGAASPAAATGATATPATSALSVLSSLTDCCSKQSSSSSERPIFVAESPARFQAHDGSSSPPSLSSLLPPPPPPPPSSSQRVGRHPQRGGGNDRGRSSCKEETAGPPSSTAKAYTDASSSPPEAARRSLRERLGGVKTDSSIQAACGTLAYPPGAHRDRGKDTAGGSNDQPILSAPGVASEENTDEIVSPSSVVSDEEIEKRREKRLKRQLALLADSPAFCGVGASPAGSAISSVVLGQTGTRSDDGRRSSSRVRSCVDHGKSARISCSSSGGGGSGSRRRSRDDHRDGSYGSATKTRNGSGGTARQQSESLPSTGGSNRGGQDWRVKNSKRKERDEDEHGPGGGGSATTEECRHVYRYPTRTAVAVATTTVIGERKRSDDAEYKNGGSESVLSGARRRRDRASLSPDSPREGPKPKRARRSTGTGGSRSAGDHKDEPLSSMIGVTVSGSNSDSSGREKDSSSKNGGGVRNRTKRQTPTPSTASRMGLETVGYSSDGGSGGGYAEDDADQTSSPPSLDRANGSEASHAAWV